jgi:hypothetical protein
MGERTRSRRFPTEIPRAQIWISVDHLNHCLSLSVNIATNGGRNENLAALQFCLLAFLSNCLLL